ncbi:MAG: hypothetical protein INQ03_18490 [Candidatus Heimdallarchaeota archaeon]|nr:hypothetical protein [Candidatus Heimdallarchaeota archaeon]
MEQSLNLIQDNQAMRWMTSVILFILLLIALFQGSGAIFVISMIGLIILRVLDRIELETNDWKNTLV